MKNRSILNIAADGLLYKNPLTFKLLGLCTAIFACTTVKNALIMGLCTAIVMLLSSLTISLLRALIANASHRISTLVVVCGYVSAVCLGVRACCPASYEELGIFLLLIAVSGLCYSHGADFAANNGVLASVVGAFFSALGYTAAMTLAAVIRELFGRGQLFGAKLFDGGAAFLATPAGGFVCLGLIAAMFAFITRKRRSSDDDQ